MPSSGWMADSRWSPKVATGESSKWMARGKIVKEVPLTVKNPDPHRDTRLARKLASGNYLVCHEGDGMVREYDGAGKVVWSHQLDLAGRPRSPGHGPEGHGTEVFGALRLKNGNTLIACGNGNRVIEVTPEGKTVWSLEQERTARHQARLGHDAASPAQRQPHHRQLPRRRRKPTALRSHPREKSRLDLPRLQKLWQQPGDGAGARSERRDALGRCGNVWLLRCGKPLQPIKGDFAPVIATLMASCGGCFRGMLDTASSVPISNV